ncbi:MAG: chromate transporter [Pseudomonadota bacterium]|nr:chromate transporter [Pseudomonadota bacterium]
MPDAASDVGTPPRSATALFFAFALLSMQSFGGALSFIERTVVRDRRWLSPEDFLGLYSIAQVLPGPTGISFCVLLGDRFFGLRGAVATLAGFLLLPSVVVIALASVFQHFQHVPQVQGALQGMGAAAIALIVTTALRMGRGLRRDRAGLLVAALSFAAVGLARLPVSTVVLTLGVLSVAWAWRSTRP